MYSNEEIIRQRVSDYDEGSGLLGGKKRGRKPRGKGVVNALSQFEGGAFNPMEMAMSMFNPMAMLGKMMPGMGGKRKVRGRGVVNALSKYEGGGVVNAVSKYRGGGVVSPLSQFEGGSKVGDFLKKHAGKIALATAGIAGLAGLAKKGYDAKQAGDMVSNLIGSMKNKDPAYGDGVLGGGIGDQLGIPRWINWFGIGKKPKSKRAPSARGQMISKLMREKGMSLGEASKYLKQQGQ
jgi:hypothetical protein